MVRNTALGYLLVIFISYTSAAGYFEDASQSNDILSAGSQQHFDLRHTIPGTPGVDYPIYSVVPSTSFECSGKHEGYYADPETRCQAFRICTNTAPTTQGFAFLCPNGTIFNQKHFVCDWYRNVNCAESELHYSRNTEQIVGTNHEMLETVRQMMEYPIKSIKQALEASDSGVGPLKQPQVATTQSFNGRNSAGNTATTHRNAPKEKENQAKVSSRDITRSQAQKQEPTIETHSEIPNQTLSKTQPPSLPRTQPRTHSDNRKSALVRPQPHRRTLTKPHTPDPAKPTHPQPESTQLGMDTDAVYVNSLGELSSESGTTFDKKNARIIAQARSLEGSGKSLNFAQLINLALNDVSSPSLSSSADGLAPDYIKHQRSTQEGTLTHLASSINGLLLASEQHPSLANSPSGEHPFEQPYEYIRPKQTPSTVRFTPNDISADSLKSSSPTSFSSSSSDSVSLYNKINLLQVSGGPSSTTTTTTTMSSRSADEKLSTTVKPPSILITPPRLETTPRTDDMPRVSTEKKEAMKERKATEDKKVLAEDVKVEKAKKVIKELTKDVKRVKTEEKMMEYSQKKMEELEPEGQSADVLKPSSLNAPIVVPNEDDANDVVDSERRPTFSDISPTAGILTTQPTQTPNPEHLQQLERMPEDSKRQDESREAVDLNAIIAEEEKASVNQHAASLFFAGVKLSLLDTDVNKSNQNNRGVFPIRDDGEDSKLAKLSKTSGSNTTLTSISSTSSAPPTTSLAPATSPQTTEEQRISTERTETAPELKSAQSRIRNYRRIATAHRTSSSTKPVTKATRSFARTSPKFANRTTRRAARKPASTTTTPTSDTTKAATTSRSYPKRVAANRFLFTRHATTSSMAPSTVASTTTVRTPTTRRQTRNSKKDLEAAASVASADSVATENKLATTLESVRHNMQHYQVKRHPRPSRRTRPTEARSSAATRSTSRPLARRRLATTSTRSPSLNSNQPQQQQLTQASPIPTLSTLTSTTSVSSATPQTPQTVDVSSSSSSSQSSTSPSSSSSSSSTLSPSLSFDKPAGSTLDDSISQNFRSNPATAGPSATFGAAIPQISHFSQSPAFSFGQEAAQASLGEQQQQQQQQPAFQTPGIVIARAEGKRIEPNSVESIVSNLAVNAQHKKLTTEKVPYVPLNDFLQRKFGSSNNNNNNMNDLNKDLNTKQQQERPQHNLIGTNTQPTINKATQQYQQQQQSYTFNNNVNYLQHQQNQQQQQQEREQLQHHQRPFYQHSTINQVQQHPADYLIKQQQEQLLQQQQQQILLQQQQQQQKQQMYHLPQQQQVQQQQLYGNQNIFISHQHQQQQQQKQGLSKFLAQQSVVPQQQQQQYQTQQQHYQTQQQQQYHLQQHQQQLQNQHQFQHHHPLQNNYQLQQQQRSFNDINHNNNNQNFINRFESVNIAIPASPNTPRLPSLNSAAQRRSDDFIPGDEFELNSSAPSSLYDGASSYDVPMKSIGPLPNDIQPQ